MAPRRVFEFGRETVSLESDMGDRFVIDWAGGSWGVQCGEVLLLNKHQQT